MIKVAIVGGGPAGSHCAFSLAENGVYSTIFDHSHPREKPCGGLVIPNVQRLFPFLKTLPIEHGQRNKMYLVSPSGRKVTLSSRNNKIRCFSRLKLDQFLLQTAVDKGAELIREKVVAIQKCGGLWKIKTTQRSYVAEILVGADGVNSLIRKSVSTSLSDVDKGICCGYLVRGIEEEDITLRFLPHMKGYLWILPRNDHTSLGIGSVEISHCRGLREELDQFIERHYPYVERISRWTALIPNIKEVKTLNIPVAGSDWILIGDAAGHVGPLLGDGILYALLDGELAARAIIERKCRLFDRSWRETYGRGLFVAVKLRKWIYTQPGLELFCKFLQLQTILH